MQFSFRTADGNGHLVEFRFDQILTGRYSIKVDGALIQNGFRIASLRRTHIFEVGTVGKSTVRIEKVKKCVFGGLLPQNFQVFVDDKLLIDIKGY